MEAARRERRRAALLCEAQYLRSTLEPVTLPAEGRGDGAQRTVLAMYAPPQPLYIAVEDAPGVAQALEDHARRGDSVRRAIAARIAARAAACRSRAAMFAAYDRAWRRTADDAEARSPSDGRHGQALAPSHYSAPHHGPTPAAAPVVPHGSFGALLLAGPARATRRTAADTVRSEEEMNRVLMGLLLEARETPETRWAASHASVPPMALSDPRTAVWAAPNPAGDPFAPQSLVSVPGILGHDTNGAVYEHDARPCALFLAPPTSLHPGWHGDRAVRSGAGVRWTAALAAQCPPSISPALEDRTVLVARSGSHDPVVWSAAEQRVFVDKYLAYPKDFARIASALPRKTVAQVIAFYYLSKHRLRLKRLVRRTPHVPGMTSPAVPLSSIAAGGEHGARPARAPQPSALRTALSPRRRRGETTDTTTADEREAVRMEALLIAGPDEHLDERVDDTL